MNFDDETLESGADESESLQVEEDPTYDDRQDDKDEKWFNQRYRVPGNVLSCLCCVLTIVPSCMVVVAFLSIL